MRGAGGEQESDAEVVRRRLDAVLGRGPAPAASPYGTAGPDDDELDDLDDDLDDDGSGRRSPPRPRGRARGRHTEDGDLAEGLGLWPQLVGALADRVPAAVRHGRWGVSGPVVAAVLVVAAVVVLVLAVRSSAGAPGVPVPVRAAATATSSSAPASGGAPPGTPTADAAAPVGTGRPTAGAGTSGGAVVAGPAPRPSGVPATGAPPVAVGEVVVHVVGRVERAGVVHLPTGSRVADALDAAGGPAPDADLARVNLARPLVDGEQVLVPAPGEELATTPAPVAVAPAGGSAAAGAGGATAPGTAPVDLNTATEADLDALPGIGPVLAQRILDVRAQLGSFTSVEELGEVSGIGEARLADLRELVVVA